MTKITTDKNLNRKFIIFLAVFAIYFFSIFIRSHIFSKMGKGNYVPYYNTEAASYFRYAQMVSQGQKVPTIDYLAQAPDGFKVFNTPIIMEYVAGYLHRMPFFKNIPFHRFVEYFNWYFSALSVFGIFMICYFYIPNLWLSLLSTLYFAVSLAAIARTVNGFFQREIFTLPFIILHLYFFIKSIDSKKKMYSLIASLLIVIVVASWEISKFYLLLFMSYPVAKFLLSRRTDDFKRSFLNYSIFQLLTLIPACLLVPYLRYRSFIFSMPMVMCYTLFLVLLVDRYISLSIWKKTSIFIFICIVLIIIFPKNKDYAHVYSIFFYKIIYLLHKPSDPGRIPFDARAIWEGPFKSPSLRRIIYTFSTFLVWGILAIFYLAVKFIKKKLNIKLEFLLFINAAFFASFLLFGRLQVFSIIAFTISSCFCLSLLAQKFLKKRKSYLIILILILLVFEWYKTWTFLSSKPFFSGFLSKVMPKNEEFGFRTDSIIRGIEWIKSNTKENDKILVRYAISPSILIYTGRPVILTPYFEPISMRDRILEINSAYYMEEKHFHDVCMKYKVDYFIYPLNAYLDNSVYSVRYLMNKMTPDKKEVVYFMQFRPEELTYFKLVYQNETFRIFKFIPEKISKSKEMPDIEYYSCYDEKVYQNMGVDSFQYLMRWYDAYLSRIWGDYYFNKKLYAQAETAYKNGLDLFPFYPQVLIKLGRIYIMQRRYQDAYLNFQKALSIDYSVSADYGLVALNFIHGLKEESYLKLREIVKRDPSYLPAVIDLIRIYKEKKMYNEAINLLRKTISYKSDFLPIYYELEALYRRIGRNDLADQIHQKIENKRKQD